MMTERYSLQRSLQNGGLHGIYHVVNGKSKRNVQLPLRVYCKAPSIVQARHIVFRMVMCIVIACFLVQGLLQRSIMSFKGAENYEPRKLSLSLKQHHQSQNLSETLYSFDAMDSVKFVPHKLFQKFSDKLKEIEDKTGIKRMPLRAPRLALVSHQLSRNPYMLLMLSVARGLQELGYDMELYSVEDGPVHEAWEAIGINVKILGRNAEELPVDWLNFEGVVVVSIEAKPIISRLIQEPFDVVPILWIIQERSLGVHVKSDDSRRHIRIDDWKAAFNRAAVVVFSDYTLPMVHSVFDSGNFFVIPGSPMYIWEADKIMNTYDEDNLRVEMKFKPDDFIIAIVGSQFYSPGTWREHALVMQALAPLMSEFEVHNESASIRIVMVCENLNNSYDVALQVISNRFGFRNGTVRLASDNDAVNRILSVADLVVYGSHHEEQAFPAALVKAMSFGKAVIAPNLTVIQKHVKDRVHAFLFPSRRFAGMSDGITKSIALAISNGTLSALARKVARTGREHARNLLVSDALENYASLVEKIIHLPSDVATPRNFSQISEKVKAQWQWELLGHLNLSTDYLELDRSSEAFWEHEQWAMSHKEISMSTISGGDDSFNYADWEREKTLALAEQIARREEDELEERKDRVKKTWEEVYRSVKRAERTKGELHERDDGELERTGQLLCIYEPYLGQGAWPFLHRHSLYRGIGLSTRGRRPGADDIDASSRLPLLNNLYYRDSLCEFGAFFALANRIDRIHKNSWIGFQSWRTAGRNVSLSKATEKRLLDAIQSRRHGSALYFWARMDRDGRSGVALSDKDFWTYCDSINAGNCRETFSDAFRKMYNLPKSWKAVPPMPYDADSWSVLHSWALPTKSFLEFVMFARMFVNALDAQHYTEHHDGGKCILSISKDPHCYCRLLELLVNVWSYHSARKMIYVNPETGHMQEHHKVKSRRGHTWINWFNPVLLKTMDEDLAEEFDTDKTSQRWLWPSTGEVYWRGIYERERDHLNLIKMERKKNSKDKLKRMRRKHRQKVLGKYVKPPPEDDFFNTTDSRILEQTNLKLP